MKILIEAVGSFTSGYLIEAIQSAGHHCIASDITEHSAGAILADSFIIFPTADDPELWQTVEKLLIAHKVNMVIPSFDEMLFGWAERKAHFANLGISVVVSDPEVITRFIDKWQSYQAFLATNIPVPEASLRPIFPVFKPREGRGGKGIVFHSGSEMVNSHFPTGYMSQQLANGDEFTIDCLFDKLGEVVYCVPRKRLMVKEGKSTSGIVLEHQGITEHIKQLAKAYCFQGPINFQCFAEGDVISFIEVNPRFGGGSSLGMAATENWIPLLVDNFVYHKPIVPTVTVQFGMKMYRQYRDVFDVN